MLAGMTRVTIALPDDLAEQVKAKAGGNVSAWFAKLAREDLLRDEYAAIAEFERDHQDPDWDAERFAA
jgi:hypothetical protein